MRKKYYLLPTTLFPLILSSCLWSKKHDPKPHYPISGAKWQQVKLYVYHKTYHGLIFNDTTYQRSAFDTLDYVQFFDDGTVNIASKVYDPLNTSGALSNPPYQYYAIPCRFGKVGPLYLFNPDGFHADTVFYNGSDSLRIHSFGLIYPYLYYNEVDAYYTRK